MQRFSHTFRIYYEDTDAGGVVYHARYVNFFERARTEWLRHLGFGQRALARDPGVLFAVRSMQLEFIQPARLDDQVRISVEPLRLGRASLHMAQQMLRQDGELLAEAQVRIACLSAGAFRPMAVPKEVLARIE